MGFVRVPEGREHRRIPIVMIVRLARVQNPLAGDEEIAYTENVSAHGVRVISRRAWKPGEELQVTSVKDWATMRGSVVYCQKLDSGRFCVGLNFHDQSAPWSSYRKQA